MKAPLSLSRLLMQGKWGMLPGERAALEGVLSVLRTAMSVEIGTWRGGSLSPISRHSEVVHAFDLVRHPDVTTERFPNVTFHVGDSHDLLPKFLEDLASSGVNVDFALVDGDHSAHGVHRDLEDLLSSPSIENTAILLHDTLHERVRAGLDEIDYAGIEKVRFVDLDFVQGRVMREGPQANELWDGLGLIVTGWDIDHAEWPHAYSGAEVYDAFSDALVSAGRARPDLWWCLGRWARRRSRAGRWTAVGSPRRSSPAACRTAEADRGDARALGPGCGSRGRGDASRASPGHFRRQVRGTVRGTHQAAREASRPKRLERALHMGFGGT